MSGVQGAEVGGVKTEPEERASGKGGTENGEGRYVVRGVVAPFGVVVRAIIVKAAAGGGREAKIE